MVTLLFLSGKATGTVLAASPALLCQGNVAPGGMQHPGLSLPGQQGQVPASPQPRCTHHEGLQLASFALFSTSLSPNRDKNRTNTLESPPKLLFWFQDDAIWVPVSNLQMQAGGGERKASESWLQSKPPAQKHSCLTLPGAKSPWPGRCPPSAEVPSLLHTWHPRQGSDFPGMGSQTSPQFLLPAGGNQSCQLQVAQGSSSEAGFSQAPKEFERHTYIPDPDSGTL